MRLPRVLPFLANAVLDLNGCQSEGIFRVPGDSDGVAELRLRIEKNRYDITGIQDVDVPASLLKFWMRDLADPLIPAEFYQRCIEAGENSEKAIQIIAELPTYHRSVAKYVIRFLQIVGETQNQAKTRMTVQNLAMVFAPNFLRCTSENPTQIFENTKFEQIFLKTLILNAKYDDVDVRGTKWDYS